MLISTKFKSSLNVSPRNMDEIWIVDTSSVIEVRRRVPVKMQDQVYEQLTALVNTNVIVYPVQVFDEIKRFSNLNSGKPDRPYEWISHNKDHATRNGTDYNILKNILEHPQVRRVVDPDKLGVEEADPFVLALACNLRDTYLVRILSEETKDRPDKISIYTACGHLRLVSMRMEAFLQEQGIWP